jgi:hypothetical protein
MSPLHPPPPCPTGVLLLRLDARHNSHGRGRLPRTDPARCAHRPLVLILEGRTVAVSPPRRLTRVHRKR